MSRAVTFDEMKIDLAGTITSLRDDDQAVVIEREGAPVAVLISPEAFRILEQTEATDWATIDALRERNANADPERVMTDATAAVAAVRRQTSTTS